MAEKKSIEAGKGHVTLGVESTALEKGLNEAKSMCSSFGKAIAGIGVGIAAMGASITAPFAYGLSVFADLGGEINRTSRITSMSFSDVQGIMAGFKISSEGLEGATRKMSAFVSGAANGEHVDTMRDLGLAISDLQGISSSERMIVLADAISKIGDAAKRSYMQTQVFGRGALGSMNITGGRAGIEARIARSNQIAPQLSDADVETAKAYNKALSEGKQATAGIWRTLGAVAAPTATMVINMTTELIVIIQRFVAANRPVLDIVFKVGTALALAGSAIATFGGLIVGAGFVLGAISSAIGGFIALASGGFGLLSAATWAWGVVTATASAVAAGAMFVYNVGLSALTAVTWLYNTAGAAAGVLWGVLTAATAVASVSTWAYTASLIAAWVWEQACSVGIALIVTALGALVIAIGAVIIAAAGIGLLVAAFIFLPGLIAAATASVMEFFSSAFGQGTQMISDLWASVSGFFQAIQDAMSTGNWEMLWEIVKTGALLAWELIKIGAMTIWEELKYGVLSILDAIGYAGMTLFSNMWTGLQIGFVVAWTEIKAIAFDTLGSIARQASVVMDALDPTGTTGAALFSQANNLSDMAGDARGTERTSQVAAINTEATTARERRRLEAEAAQNQLDAERDFALAAIDTDYADQLQQYLDYLSQSAAVDAAAAAGTSAVGDAQNTEQKDHASSVGTFSGAALALMGGTENPNQRLEDIGQETRDLIAGVLDTLVTMPRFTMF